MGTRTIQRLWWELGVLTDVTSAVLSDPDGAYGVKRNDLALPKAIVVFDGTEMTRVSAGTYEYTFTEPADDLTYTAWVEILYLGLTYRFLYEIPAVVASGLSAYDSMLRRAIGRLLGYGLDPSTWEAVQVTNCMDVIGSGLRKFYTASDWSFLRKATTVSLEAGAWQYALPVDFSRLYGFPVIPVGGRVEPITADLLLALRAKRELSGRPRYCAVRAKTLDPSLGTRYELLVYPTPDLAESMLCQYLFEPRMLDSTAPYPPGGPTHSETLLQACLTAAEETVVDNQGVHAKLFEQQLARSIAMDGGGK